MKKIKLEDKFITQLVLLPESGMGYQIVTVKLSDGRELKNRTVLNSEYLQLEDDESFNSKDIVEITARE